MAELHESSNELTCETSVDKSQKPKTDQQQYVERWQTVSEARTLLSRLISTEDDEQNHPFGVGPAMSAIIEARRAIDIARLALNSEAMAAWATRMNTTTARDIVDTLREITFRADRGIPRNFVRHYARDIEVACNELHEAISNLQYGIIANWLNHTVGAIAEGDKS